MQQNENGLLAQDTEVKDVLVRIKQYLDTDIYNLRKQAGSKDAEIKILKEELEKLQHLMEGNRQLINKLLGDLSKLQNDIDWYKRTYVKRSLLGTIREKIFKK